MTFFFQGSLDKLCHPVPGVQLTKDQVNPGNNLITCVLWPSCSFLSNDVLSGIGDTREVQPRQSVLPVLSTSDTTMVESRNFPLLQSFDLSIDER